MRTNPQSDGLGVFLRSEWAMQTAGHADSAIKALFEIAAENMDPSLIVARKYCHAFCGKSVDWGCHELVGRRPLTKSPLCPSTWDQPP